MYREVVSDLAAELRTLRPAILIALVIGLAVVVLIRPGTAFAYSCGTFSSCYGAAKEITPTGFGGHSLNGIYSTQDTEEMTCNATCVAETGLAYNFIMLIDSTNHNWVSVGLGADSSGWYDIFGEQNGSTMAVFTDEDRGQAIDLTQATTFTINRVSVTGGYIYKLSCNNARGIAVLTSSMKTWVPNAYLIGGAIRGTSGESIPATRFYNNFFTDQITPSTGGEWHDGTLLQQSDYPWVVSSTGTTFVNNPPFTGAWISPPTGNPADMAGGIYTGGGVWGESGA
jgi:hypothetical protein